MGTDLLRSVIGRAVVDDDDLQIRIVACQDMTHCADDDLAFIVCRDEHRLKPRGLREQRRHPARFGAPIPERCPAQKQDAS